MPMINTMHVVHIIIVMFDSLTHVKLCCAKLFSFFPK